MKNNQPVTGVDKDYHADANILSTTNLKGAITYINPDFIDISGFTEEELLNSNHNIVRHPDMPPAAFESLWGQIKAGNPWMGMVKNRCKNGDHYWVDAYVMPIQKNGTTVEYQSVRYKPEPDLVRRAEPLYKRLREGKKIPVSLGSRLGLKNQLILGSLIALLPAIVVTQIEALSAYTLVGFLITALSGAAINTILMKPFGNLVGIAKKVFDNYLMSKIYTGRDDEIGQIQLALKMQHSQVNAIVGRLSDTTRILGEIANVTSETSSQANQGVATQQNEITQVATAMTEMAATVQEIAKNAARAAESTEIGLKETAAGKQVVDGTISSINSLATEVQQAADVIEKLSEYSTNIGDILGVIKGIAEQTNLLALNAAIEAARAGEQGRGFAVVADEVRTLAGRTQESAQEIEEMIERLQGGSKEAVKVMEQSRDKAGISVQQAARAGEALEVITGAINTITEMNFQIATASEEQSAVAEEINQNVVNISKVADSTSQGAQQSVDATHEMVETIQRLDSLVSQFMKRDLG